MKITSTQFEKSAPNLEACPAWELAEFAFIGRSNVGKSSLLNMLTGKKDLARVSATPGATRLINFYTVNKRWCLVDLPGYGYSKAHKSIREGFHEAVSGYLSGRPNLRCVFVLIDSRLTPQKIDLEFCNWLAVSEIPFVLIFTKTDKLKLNKVKANAEVFLAAFSEVCDGTPRWFLSSAKTASGKGEILQFVDQALRA